MSYKPGQQIGPYILGEILGRGSFGSVWLAEKRTRLTCTQVAIKIPHAGNLDLDAVAEEARIWVKASGHPNVLPIIEADVYDDQFVIVSEYAANGTLRDFLRSLSEPVGTETALNLTIDMLRGLQFLHEQGIVHRDLKPTNILFQRDVPRISDFGISRLVDQYSSSGVAGTFAYMAPEAFNGVRNEQTDIWALGIILYELLSLEHPFGESDIPSLVRAITSDQPVPHLSTHESFTLELVMRKALEKEPEKRYRTAREMLEDLRSDAIRFEMILRPKNIESMAPDGDVDVTFPLETEYLEKARIQHYAFTRDYLRNRAFAIPRPFVNDLLQKETGRNKLRVYWGMSARQYASDDGPYIAPESLDCFPFSEVNGLTGVVITLPQPKGYVEAFFVAAVLVYTHPPTEEEYELRYFTLDLGKGKTGDLRTILSEWGENGHIYSEVLSVQNMGEFQKAVKDRLPDYSQSVVEQGNVKYPFHTGFQYTFLGDGPPLTNGEIKEIENLAENFTRRGPVIASVCSTDNGFELNVYTRYKTTHSFGIDLFMYLSDNFFGPRERSVSYL